MNRTPSGDSTEKPLPRPARPRRPSDVCAASSCAGTSASRSRSAPPARRRVVPVVQMHCRSLLSECGDHHPGAEPSSRTPVVAGVRSHRCARHQQVAGQLCLGHPRGRPHQRDGVRRRPGGEPGQVDDAQQLATSGGRGWAPPRSSTRRPTCGSAPGRSPGPPCRVPGPCQGRSCQRDARPSCCPRRSRSAPPCATTASYRTPTAAGRRHRRRPSRPRCRGRPDRGRAPRGSRAGSPVEGDRGLARVGVDPRSRRAHPRVGDDGTHGLRRHHVVVGEAHLVDCLRPSAAR